MQDEELEKLNIHEKEIISFINEFPANRWRSIAKTDIEKGFMALRRSLYDNS